MTQDATGYNQDSSEDIIEVKNPYKKQDSTISFMSYETVDIQEERAYNSRRSKQYLYAFVGLNVALNLWQLYVHFQIHDIQGDINWGVVSYGFKDYTQ